MAIPSRPERWRRTLVAHRTLQRAREDDLLLVSDTFSRADNASSLGSADTGQAWTALAGTWGISGNRAYNPSATSNGVAYVDAGVSDGLVECVIPVLGGGPGLYFRIVDADDYLRCVSTGTALIVEKRVASTFTQIASLTYTLVAGDRLGVRLTGSTIDVSVNGESQGVVTDSAHQSATMHGIGFNFGVGSSAARFDNFRVSR